MSSYNSHAVNGNGNGNGNGVTWRYLVGILIAGWVAIGGWAWQTTTAQVLKLQESDRDMIQRLVVMETDNRHLKAQLERIEEKLDEALRRDQR